ncbi:hypothetical protein L208DRAFT_1076094, partial [Tricholoma matsutake]
CTTGLSICHVGEHFQRSNETISKYFLKMLNIFSSNPFYADYRWLIDLVYINDPISKYITDNDKFYPFFAGAIGALDGTHFDCSGTPEQR